jgi:Spy/CpxP family protein refolding chaperone
MEREIFNMMKSNETGTKQKIDCLLNMENQRKKEEKLIEIMKSKVFKKSEAEQKTVEVEEEEERKMEEVLYLSNSWGFGNRSRKFIGRNKSLT